MKALKTNQGRKHSGNTMIKKLELNNIQNKLNSLNDFSGKISSINSNLQRLDTLNPDHVGMIVHYLCIVAELCANFKGGQNG